MSGCVCVSGYDQFQLTCMGAVVDGVSHWDAAHQVVAKAAETLLAGDVANRSLS